MKFLITSILSLLMSFVIAQKTLNIKTKNYNDKGLVINKDGKLYSGKAKESLKKGEYLIGKIEKGGFTGVWEYYKKNELKGYHYYEDNGNTTIATDSKKNLDWIEVISDEGKKVTEIKVSDNQIEKLYIIDYKEDGSHKNTFEYEKFKTNYYDKTITDYDYNSLSVIDFFENNKGEQEIIFRDFDKHHELIKVTSKNHHVKDIFFLTDILETPEDADYSLEKGFNASFTELKNKDNFKLTLLNGKSPIFEIFVSDGQIVKLDKVLNNESLMLIYTKENGYVPDEHKKANTIIEEALKSIK